MNPYDGFNDLLRRAQAGESQAIDDLMARLRPYVEQVARVKVDNPHASRSASDLVQESLLRVWQKLDQFQGADRDENSWLMFRSWVAQLLGRVHLNIERDRVAQKRHPGQKMTPLQAGSSDDSRIIGVDPPANDPTASQQVGQIEESERIRRALDKQGNDVGATIIRMHFFEGLSLREIAERLNLSYDQVRHRYQTSLRNLEEELGPLS